MDKNQMMRFIAKRVAGELTPGTLVNLGVGIPTLVAEYIAPDSDILLEGENGVIGLGKTALDVIDATSGKKPEEADDQVINAGAGAAGIDAGASFFDSTTSFGLIRGGHVHTTVLGTMEVDEEGTLANYLIPGKKVAGMGGAMDLCNGVKEVIVATYHTMKGNPKILKKCRLPITAKRCVTKIVTEMGVFQVTPQGIKVIEYNPEFTLEEIQRATEPELIIPDDVKPTPHCYFEGL